MQCTEIELACQSNERKKAQSAGSRDPVKVRRGDADTVIDVAVIGSGFGGSTMGTQKLLHRMRDEGHLPRLSPRLGELTRTNSEAILAARSFGKDKGSNAMGLLSTALAQGCGRFPWVTWLREFVRHPGNVLRNLSLRNWLEQTIIALVMQTHDNSITCYTKRGWFGRRFTSGQGHGKPNPTWIPSGHEVVRRIARHIGGEAYGGWNDVFNIPLTAHFPGGAPIGDSIETGVVDPYLRVYAYPGLHVVDGAAVSANLGVNPSLTITAHAERAMSLWPNLGDPDPRPSLNEPYQRLQPVYPKTPIVPVWAPAALRISLDESLNKQSLDCGDSSPDFGEDETPLAGLGG